MLNTLSRLALSEKGKPATQFIAWLIGFFAFLNVYSMQSVLPLVMKEFHASPVQAGFTIGATVLGIALISPFMGMLSDALGRKIVLCSSLFVLSVPTVLIPAADSFSSIIALRFLQGLATPGIVVVFIAYISEEFRSGSIARVTTAYVGGTVIGGFCGRFITGHVGDVLGWRGAFVTLAVLTFAGAVVTTFLLPPSRHFVANRNVGSAFRTLRSHLVRPRLLAACAVGFCVLFSLVSTFTYINLYLASAPFNFSTAALANVFTVYLVGGVVTPLSGRFIVRFGFRRSIVGALAISAAGLLLTLMPFVSAIIFRPSRVFFRRIHLPIHNLQLHCDQRRRGPFIGNRPVQHELLRWWCCGFLGSWAGLRGRRLDRFGSFDFHDPGACGRNRLCWLSHAGWE